MSSEPHKSHGAIIKRLKRAEGHLRNVISMIETGRPCLELAQQLQAVESAIGAAKRVLIRDHLDQCLDHAAVAEPADAKKAFDDFREITKFL